MALPGGCGRVDIEDVMLLVAEDRILNFSHIDPTPKPEPDTVTRALMGRPASNTP